MSAPKKRMPVAFQGEQGAYSEIAAARFGTPVAKPTFDAVFQAVVEKEAALGVLPVENSLGGTIHQNYDLLLRYPVRIVAETVVSIEHCLLGVKPGSVGIEPGSGGVKGISIRQAIRRVREVVSHPQALAQCQKFFEAHPHLAPVAGYDTAGSAKQIALENNPEKGAIASRRAAELYGLSILAERIADEPDNRTRFVAVALPEFSEKQLKRLEITANSARRKTSVVFTLHNEAGALFKALAALSMRGIDLTKIESRPLKHKPFDYIFYLDFLGDERSAAVSHALAHLRELAPMLRVLGSYAEVQSGSGRMTL